MVAMEKKARQGYLAWTQFVAKVYDCFDSDTHHLGCLTNLNHFGIVEDFIVAFEHLDLRTKGMSDTFFREFFIGGLKDEIYSHVLMVHPRTWLEYTQRAKESQHIVSSQTHKPSFSPRLKPTNFFSLAPPLKILKLTTAKMDECQLKGIFYNHDDEYFIGYKCKEKNIYMVVTEDLSEEYVVVAPMEELPLPSDLTPPSNP